MSAPKMLDTLIETFAAARMRGETPMSWVINRAAETELLMDTRVHQSMGAKQTISDMPFCGIPLSIEDDGCVSSPMFRLQVAPIGRSALRLDERSHESHDNCHSVTLCDVTQLSHDSP